MYVMKKENMKVPSFIYSEPGTIEDGALEQMERISSLPFIFHHTALMSDGHLGKGACIGSVFATKNVIIPHAIGYDINCGICLVKTSLKEIDVVTLKEIMNEIRKVIPTGYDHHKVPQDDELMPELPNYNPNHSDYIVHQEYENARTQIGTMGGNRMIVSRLIVK